VHGSGHDGSSLLDSDEDTSDGDGPGSSDDDEMEEIAMYDEPKLIGRGSGPPSPVHTRSPAEQIPTSGNQSSELELESASADAAGSPQRKGSFQSNGSETPTVGRRSGSRRNSRKSTAQDITKSEPIPVGERLKQKLLESGVLSTLLVRHAKI